MKLSPFHVTAERTLWIDAQTGAGTDDDGLTFPPVGGVTTLADVLLGAERTHSTRVLLTGETLPRGWFLDVVPGWSHGRHHLDHETPTGRYTHTAAGVHVEVRRAAEWFGAGDYTPTDARAAWQALGHELNRTHRTGAALLRSPGATGRDLWVRAAGGEVPDPIDLELQALIRSTSPQHRIEILPAVRAIVPAVWVLDARWAYAALTKGLGSGPATMLTGAQAADQQAADPFARARYRVTFAAPSWWTKHGPAAPGLLLARAGDLASDGWHCPMAGTTWADAAEVDLAIRSGWRVDFLEGIAFTPGRPLDTWTARLVKTRDQVSDDEHGPVVARMVRGAVRAILLHAVGAWHSSGTDETTVTASPMVAPAGEGWSTPDRLENGTALWRRRAGTTNVRALAMQHPEWSSQVWGRAHARILSSPTSVRLTKEARAAGGVDEAAGILGMQLGETMAVYGDALMTNRRPGWADHDDGRPGRLRVKGHLCGPIAWPTGPRERDELTRAAEAAGDTCEKGCR